jgi:hypothetical protein
MTNIINDGYIGSGHALKRAYDKYGTVAFTKEILYNFDNPYDMWNMEAEIVNEDFVKSKKTYNLIGGGRRGPEFPRDTPYYKSGDHVKNTLAARELAIIATKQKRIERIEKYNLRPKLCKQCDSPIEYDKRINIFCSSSCAASNNNIGRTVTPEHRMKTSKSLIIVDGKHQKKLKQRQKNKDDKIELEKTRMRLVMYSDIDFSKPGWSIALAGILGFIHRKSASDWIRKAMPTFHEYNCFTRSKNNGV